MNTPRRNQQIAVGVGIIVVTILFFGGNIWEFITGSQNPATTYPTISPEVTLGSQNPSEVQQKAANISQVSGIEIYDIKIGTGAEAAPGKTVKADYVAVLLDGTQFDSSLERGVPYEFKLGNGSVIKGLDLGVVGMKVGGIRQLVVSPELGFGPQTIGLVPANATLIFQVELKEVK